MRRLYESLVPTLKLLIFKYPIEILCFSKKNIFINKYHCFFLPLSKLPVDEIRIIIQAYEVFLRLIKIAFLHSINKMNFQHPNMERDIIKLFKLTFSRHYINKQKRYSSMN